MVDSGEGSIQGRGYRADDLSVVSQLEDFSRGVIDLRRVVFDGSVLLLCLFFTRRVVDSWRWG